MLSELLNLNLFAFLLIFTRVGTAMSVLPGFGSQQISMTIRLTFALLVTLVMTPTLMPLLPQQPSQTSVLFLLLASEALVGVFLGIFPRIIMGALQTAGTLIAMLAAMANAFVMDPVAEQQSSVIASFLGTMGVTLVFVTNTHHLMLNAIAESYAVFDPMTVPMVGDMSDFMAHTVADSFRIGVQLASPLIISGVAYYLGLGIMGRLMPQLPVFFFGMPIQISLQISLLMISLTSMMMVFMRFYTETLMGFSASWGG